MFIGDGRDTGRETAVDLLIHDAAAVATMDSAGTRLPAGSWIAVDDGRIAATGSPRDLPPEARCRVDASGALVTPGLVNTHQHLYQNLTRSMAGPMAETLDEWFWAYFGYWRRVDEEALRSATRLGLYELALSGVTTSADYHYVQTQPYLLDAQIDEARGVGMRFLAVRGAMTRGESAGGICPDDLAEDEDDVLEDSRRLIEAYHDPSPTAMTQVALGPSNLMSCTAQTFRRVAELAAEHEVALHTHTTDDPVEIEYVAKSYGTRPLPLLDDLGWLRPGTVLVHMVLATQEEIDLVARRGAGVSHCPSAMLIDGAPTAPVAAMLDAGVTVGIGCDGAAAADHQSLWLEAKLAMLLARLREGTAAAMGPERALSLATRDGARLLGRVTLGSIEAGACADLALWRMDGIANAGGIADPVASLMYGGPAQVWASFVGGRPLVAEGQVIGVDIATAVARHNAIAARVQAPV